MKIKDVALILSKPDTGSTTMALLCLSCEPGGVPLSVAAQRIGVTTAAITGLADVLEKIPSLAERQGKPGDRRVKLLCATEEGRALVEDLQGKLDAICAVDSSSMSVYPQSVVS